MRSIRRLAIIPAAIATCAIMGGCFSYHRTDSTQPAVVETAPAVVAVPATTSSTTTTTSDAPVVEQQRTTTVTTP